MIFPDCSLEKDLHINMGDIHFRSIDNNYVDFVTASFMKEDNLTSDE